MTDAILASLQAGYQWQLSLLAAACILVLSFVAKQLFKSALDDDRERWELASPMSHVGPDAPPMFLLHGTNDTVVPVQQARSFAAMLQAASLNPVVYAEMPRAQHAFDGLPSIRAHHTVHAVERFLAVIRSEHGGPTPAQAVDGETVS